MQSPINAPSPAIKVVHEEVKESAPFEFFDALDNLQEPELPDLQVRVEETGETLNLREPEEVLSPEKAPAEDPYLDTVIDDIPSGDSDKSKSEHSPMGSEVLPSSEQKSENPFDFP